MPERLQPSPLKDEDSLNNRGRWRPYRPENCQPLVHHRVERSIGLDLPATAERRVGGAIRIVGAVPGVIMKRESG